jgi:hypothetical protein
MRRHPVVVLVLVALAALTLIAKLHGQKAPASPRKQAEVTFADGKKVAVDYGAPSVRGRKIMGELVPYGKVWRTGANEATGFVTDTDLTVGGTKVPAGKYTVYTMPDANSWKLIINKQTGQWGTEYDEKQDLARIDLKKTALKSPVEQMMISFDKKGGNAATMNIQWESTGLSVDVQEAK